MAVRPVDEKIVAMKMDNSDFVKKATQTTSLFGKLTNALNKIPGVNLGKTTQELNGIQSASSKINMEGLSSSIQTVANRFSNLGIIATTALVNITNRAVDAGLAITRSLTLDQVNAGFQEYELKMRSIGTMLANTEWAGSTLDDVKDTLNELNDYADKTIYNFAEMTSNIGRFTAAGVTLEDSAIAIKGLGNLAAISGSETHQLNTAMYQMSQALAAGKLNLMDWNSMVNAGMGGKKTQDALLETAKAMGINVDMSEGFRNSIGDGWLTAEVFLETLKKFGKDKAMTEAATKVRTFTGMMDALQEGIGSGWAETWELIFGDFEEATEFWTRFSNKITGFFEKQTKARNDMLGEMADGGGIENIFKGLSNVLKPLSQIFLSMKLSYRSIFPATSASDLIKLTERFRDFTAGLTLSSDTLAKLMTIFKGVFAIFSIVWEITKRLASAFKQLIPENMGDGILGLLANVAKVIIELERSIKEGNKFTDVIDSMGGVFASISKGVEATIDKLGEFGRSIRENIGKAVDWVKGKLAPIGDWLKQTFGGGFGGDEILGSGAIVGIGLMLVKAFEFFDNFENMARGVADTLEGVGDAFKNFAFGIKMGNLLLIAVSIAILASALKTLEGINAKDLAKGITTLGVSLGIMMAGLAVVDKFNLTGGFKASITLVALATAVTIMAGALKKISDLKPKELAIGVGGLVGVVTALSLAVIAMSKFGGKVKAGSVQLIALATAVYILAGAVEAMSKIDPDRVWESVAAIGLVLAQLALFLNLANKTKFGIGSALGVLAAAGAIKIMVSAMDDISKINTKQLIKGLGTIGIILLELGLFSKLVNPVSLAVAGAGMLAIAVALNAIMVPVKIFSKMSWTEIAKGLGAMGAALLIIGGASKLLMGSAIAGAGLLIMAAALNLLVIPIKIFANMSWNELIKGFVGLAGGLAIVAGVSMLLTPAIVPMLGFSAALLAMGVAALAVGAGIALFGTGITLLATMTATSVAAVVSAIALLLQGFAELIPGAVKFVVNLGIALIEGLGRLIPSLVDTVVEIIVKLLETIAKNLPRFIEAGSDIAIGFMDGIAEKLPKVIESATKMVLAIIEGMAETIDKNGPKMVQATMNLMGSVLLVVVEAGVQMINALFGWIPGVQDATAAIGVAAETYIRQNFKAKDAGDDKGVEFSKGLESKKGNAQTAGKVIANAGKTGAGSISMSTTGADFGLGFASGINSNGVINRVSSAARAIARAASNTVKSWLDIRSPSRVAEKDGGFFGEGLARGILDKTKRVGESAKGLAVTAKDSLNRFLDGFDTGLEGDNELHFKAVIDYDRLDPNRFGNRTIGISPDTSLTRGLVGSARADMRQNDNNVTSEQTGQTAVENHYKYDIHVDAGNLLSRAERRKLALELQDEIKNIDDGNRISRGEEVVF